MESLLKEMEDDDFFSVNKDPHIRWRILSDFFSENLITIVENFSPNDALSITELLSRSFYLPVSSADNLKVAAAVIFENILRIKPDERLSAINKLIRFVKSPNEKNTLLERFEPYFEGAITAIPPINQLSMITQLFKELNSQQQQQALLKMFTPYFEGAITAIPPINQLSMITELFYKFNSQQQQQALLEMFKPHFADAITAIDPINQLSMITQLFEAFESQQQQQALLEMFKPYSEGAITAMNPIEQLSVITKLLENISEEPTHQQQALLDIFEQHTKKLAKFIADDGDKAIVWEKIKGFHKYIEDKGCDLYCQRSDFDSPAFFLKQLGQLFGTTEEKEILRQLIVPHFREYIMSQAENVQRDAIGVLLDDILQEMFLDTSSRSVDSIIEAVEKYGKSLVLPVLWEQRDTFFSWLPDSQINMLEEQLKEHLHPKASL